MVEELLPKEGEKPIDVLNRTVEDFGLSQAVEDRQKQLGLSRLKPTQLAALVADQINFRLDEPPLPPPPVPPLPEESEEAEEPDEREACAAGSTEPEFPVRVVPALPHFEEVVCTAVKQDFFSATFPELMRKAGDELTLGLELFILYTLIESAKPGRKPLCFFPSRREFDDNGFYVQTPKAEESIQWDPKGKVSVRQFVKDFLSTARQKEIRTVLRHIVNIHRNGSSHSNFYDRQQDPRVLAQNVHRCFRAIFHNNSLVPCEPGESFAAISLRERELALLTGRQVQKLLACLITKPKRRVDSECQELLKAAELHFTNVRAIFNLIKKLNKKPASNDPLDSLENLKQATSSMDPTAPLCVDEEFVLVHLWPRFGAQNVPNEEVVVDESDDDFIPVTKENSVVRLGFQNTSRFSPVETERKSDPLLVKTSFAINPIGATNLDMVNRALDLTTRVLRQAIILALQPGGPKKRNPNRQALVDAISSLPEDVFALKSTYVIKGPQGRQIEGQRLFERDPKVHGCEVFNEFCKSKGHTTPDDACLLGFVSETAHWCDPHFLFKFFRGIRVREEYLFLQAKQLSSIRDRAKHSHNLRKPVSFDSVSEDIQQLLEFIRDVQAKLDVILTDLTEYIALMEVRAALKPYKKWRGRTHAASNGLTSKAADPTADGGQNMAKCREFVRGTIRNLSALTTRDDIAGILQDGSITSRNALLSLFSSMKRHAVRDARCRDPAAEEHLPTSGGMFAALMSSDSDSEPS
jgi:hypothetical protein